MALSNWATLAHGTDGTCGRAELSFLGIFVEIYKNFVYVRDSLMNDLPEKRRRGLTVNSGDFNYGPLRLHAARYAGQHAVFVLAEITDWDAEPSEYRYLAGIGCSGYMTTLEWIRKYRPDWAAQLPPADQMREVRETHSGGGGDPDRIHLDWDDAEGKPQRVSFEGSTTDADVESMWVGVREETYQAFLQWLDQLNQDGEIRDDEYVARVKAATPLQFNQGNAFFADNGVGELVGEPIGAAAEPLLTQMLKPQKTS